MRGRIGSSDGAIGMESGIVLLENATRIKGSIQLKGL